MADRTFIHNVAIYRGSAFFYRAAAAAEHLLNAGLAVVKRRRGAKITEIELTPLAIGWMQGTVDPARLGLHPGSYGIIVEILGQSGRHCFNHRRYWPEVIPTMRRTGRGGELAIAPERRKAK